ncbi:hypothetical protein, partial [Brucella intermedia]|uniref:hypothetical protein n=1 Tax=Brucella intermedia TaxID=94625 RepID=UPI001AEF33C2
KPNKPKIGIRRAGYKGQACNADMHFWVAKKKPPRSGLARWGGTPSKAPNRRRWWNLITALKKINRQFAPLLENP